jgi:uncharacterized protein YbaP (TraB family)
MKKVLTLLVLLFTALFTSAQSKNEKSLLWEISGPEGKISYLFGTYHLLGSDFINENPTLNNVYSNANNIVVETVIDSAQLPQMAQYSMMQESIKGMLDYLLLSEKIEPLVGAPMVFLDNMKPMALATMLTLQMATAETPDTFLFEGMPIDQFFAWDAKKKNKNILPLETMLEQMELLFNSETVEDQMEALMYMVKEPEEMQEMTQNTIKAYIQQDLDAMVDISNDYEEDMGDMTKLLDERNENWIPKLKPLLAEGSTFIAVGALHLPGELGLLELLRAEGYTLKALELK